MMPAVAQGCWGMLHSTGVQAQRGYCSFGLTGVTTSTFPVLSRVALAQLL